VLRQLLYIKYKSSAGEEYAKNMRSTKY